MKNFGSVFLGILLLFIISLNNAQAVSVADFTPTIDKKIAKMETTSEKIEYLQSFSDLLASSKYTKDKNSWLYAEIRNYTLNMLNAFQSQLMEEWWEFMQSSKITISNLPHISDNLWNINEQKVREAILSWHNQERKSLWYNAYLYNLDLEWSATLWANKLSASGKTSNLHLRNDGDGYYNYNSMLNRFSSLWIDFPKSIWWWASFSESIWYNTYRCSKSDCTDDLIAAIKKTRTWLIMKEKTSMWSHYKAVIMKHFTQMWVWVAIDKSHNRYYVVFHYWVNF